MLNQPQPFNTGGLDLSAIGPPPNLSVDKESVQLARDEENFLLDGKKREHERTQAVKDRIHFWIIFGITAAAVLFLALVIVRAIHMMVSKEYMWLSEQQIALIDTTIKFVFSSAFGGLVIKRIGNALS